MGAWPLHALNGHAAHRSRHRAGSVLLLPAPAQPVAVSGRDLRPRDGGRRAARVLVPGATGDPPCAHHVLLFTGRTRTRMVYLRPDNAMALRCGMVSQLTPDVIERRVRPRRTKRNCQRKSLEARGRRRAAEQRHAPERE